MNLTQYKSVKFNVARIITCSEVEGPYKRMAIWFQGCNIRCPGCCNEDLQEFKVAHIMSYQKLLELILDSKVKHNIEGVTFCGGEPSLQKNLHLLGLKLRELNIGTILFSGFYIEQLPKELVESMDLILDGPFMIQNLEHNRRLIGSTNQHIIPITSRYLNQINWFFDNKQMIQEVNLSDGIYLNGDALVDNDSFVSNSIIKN